MPASAAACIAACPRRSPPTCRCSRAPASSASCASPSSWPQSRPRKLLTVVTKSNAQRHGMVMWDEIAAEVAARVPRRDLGQDAGRRHDHAHGAEARRRSTPSSPPTCTPTSCPISPPRWPARSASRRPPTSIPSAHSPRCSSRSTARPSTSSARASPIRSAPSGPRVMMLEHLGETGRGRAPDAGDRARHRRHGAAHARPRRHRPRPRRSRAPCARRCWATIGRDDGATYDQGTRSRVVLEARATIPLP